jgi:serine O-acetyltransferase
MPAFAKRDAASDASPKNPIETNLKYGKSFEQLTYLRQDLSAQVGRAWWRWLTMWLWHGSAPAITTYRLNRCFFLFLGENYRILRIVLWPLLLPLRLLGPVLDINYRADIGPGLKVLHPSMGVLISANAVCGCNLELTGGNWITSRRRTRPGDIRVGDEVKVRANAVVLGPVSIGDRCVLGAGSVVLDDCLPGLMVVGVPARPIERRTGAPVDGSIEAGASGRQIPELQA